MKYNKTDYLRECVYFYCVKYKKIGKKFTLDHFISEVESKSTINDSINCSEY